MAERRPNWTPALVMVAGALLAVGGLVIFFGSSNKAPITAPSVSVAPSASPTPLPDAAPATVQPSAAPTADASHGADANEEDAEDEPPPPWVIDKDANNPEIAPELPQTPEWKMGKTQRILEVVSRRAERVQKEIEALDKQGKKVEADEKRALLKRLNRRMDAMKKDIEGYKKEILADGGTIPPGGFAPDGAPL
ncbi:MAG: hypothetical protein ACXVEF_43895 [Polyangiales bacterium]